MAPSGIEAAPAAARRRPRPAGFTLLEVLVALAVLSITLLALYQAYSTTLYIQASTRGLWKAMVYANNELAHWERMPQVDVSVAQGDFPLDGPMAGYSWRREISDEEPLPGVRVRKVALQLSWHLGASTQKFQAEIFVVPHS
ncbi:MAG TPA: prepilin-type N-terminal cleavage/methylation domain-containing protein [bacterium]|nr:prepilin-type N-terminal cleavage/methylation domain-containing protein [bacterium]